MPTTKKLKTKTNQKSKTPLAKPSRQLPKKSSVTGSYGVRRLKQPRYKSFKLQKRIKPLYPKLPGSFSLFWRSLKLLFRNWKFFLIIIVIYGVLNLLLVRDLANGTSLSQLKSVLDPFAKTNTSQLSNGFTLFLYLLGNSNNSNNANAGVFQTILLIIISLAIIWGLRQAYNGIHARVRDAFYQGMNSLIMFILILLVIGLQLIPFILGATLYNLVMSNGIAVYTIEKWLWALLFFILAVITIYMICSSIFALYIITLPDMTPMKALRSARELVMHRRWEVLRKVIFLPIALIVIATIIMVPLLLLSTPIAVWIFFVMTMAGLVVIHSYVYALYRELLL
ncbi:MAG: hypothetical protein ABSB12_01225 [Candidatus Saccharimonadales bacterium]